MWNFGFAGTLKDAVQLEAPGERGRSPIYKASCCENENEPCWWGSWNFHQPRGFSLTGVRCNHSMLELEEALVIQSNCLVLCVTCICKLKLRTRVACTDNLLNISSDEYFSFFPQLVQPLKWVSHHGFLKTNLVVVIWIFLIPFPNQCPSPSFGGCQDD